MSEEQFIGLLANLKINAGLQKKFKSATDLDSAVEMALQAGFDVSKADGLKHEANQTMVLSVEELEEVAGRTAVPCSANKY